MGSDLKKDMNTQSTTTSNPELSAGGGPPGKKPKQAYVWFWLLVVVIVAGAGFFFLQRRARAQAESEMQMGRHAMDEKAIPITAAKVTKGDIGIYINGLGTVTPVYTDTMTARVQGEITQVYYREGQIVKKGDPLVEIDPRPYQVQLAQAEGQYQHDLGMLQEARIDLDRYKAAFARNAIAKQQLDDQEQIVLQDEGTVKNDQAAIDNAKLQLVYCHITSPIDGRVGLRLVDPGNMVQANSTTALVVVTQEQPITVIFTVAEDSLGEIERQLRQGHRMSVTALDRTQQTKLAEGYLQTIDNQIDPTTGTVRLRALFQNNDHALFPNQFVNAKLLVDTQHNVMLVPNAAIQRNAQTAFVYTIGSDDTAHMQSITVGVTDGTQSAVQGVQSGEEIATNGFNNLQDGAKVTIRGASRNAANASAANGAEGQ